jgi:hypothetical protein
MVAQLSTYVKKKERIFHYLVHAHHFQERTLNLLTYKNLKKLALEYGYEEVTWY